jgi:hypothetical protein
MPRTAKPKAPRKPPARKVVTPAQELLSAKERPIEEPEGAEVIAAPPLEPTISWVNPNVVTNCIKGTKLYLKDGSRLAFGESAQVTAEEAAFLRERGQAE